MVYENFHEYLTEQVKKPMQEALKKGDKKEAMEILDFCITKYEETNAFAKGFEDFALEKGVKMDLPIAEFVLKYVVKYLPKPKKSKEVEK